jgi:hypothetical protein
MKERGTAGNGAPLRDLGALALGRHLVDRFSQLARKEVELARYEFRRDARRALTASIFGGVAAATGISALVCGLVAAIAALGIHWTVTGVAILGLCLFALVCVGFSWLCIQNIRAARPRPTLREAKATLGLLARAQRPPSVPA